MKIVMLSTRDYAGSGRKICEAVQMQGHQAQIFTVERHNYGYFVDGTIADGDEAMIQKAVNSADIIHFKGDEPPKDIWNGVRIPKELPKVVTVGGSSFRRQPNGRKCKVANGTYPLADYFTAQVRTAITPDLNYPGYQGIYTQHCVNSTSEEYKWRRKVVPLIVHAPSQRAKKGTDMVLRAVQWLKDDGYRFEYRTIENVTNADCVELKSKASIYIDQLSDTGFYGMSSVEAMQYGIPCVAYISRQAMEQSQDKLHDCPVLNPYKSATSLLAFLKFYLDHPQELEDISYLTKEFSDSFHSFEVVGSMWNDIYKSLN